MFEKFLGFFDPSTVKNEVHIIGCGAIGSTLAMNFARCGITNIHLWDFDTVQAHNIANQQYRLTQVDQPKTQALQDMMKEINPHIKLVLHGKWIEQLLRGHVFLAVDNIETRAAIVKKNMYNNSIDSMWDFRMRLKDAQHYGYDWKDTDERKKFFSTMQFTQEEADASTPVNACNMTMSIIPTVDMVVAVGVANFINYLHGQMPERLVMVNPFEFMVG